MVKANKGVHPADSDMTEVRTAAETLGRFRAEQDYISQIVAFLQMRSEIRDADILELNRLLSDHALQPIPMRVDERLTEPFSPEEIDMLVTSIKAETPAVHKALRAHEQKLSRQIPLMTPRGTSLAHPVLLGEWVNYLMTQFPLEPSQGVIEAVRNHSVRMALEQDRDEGITDQVLTDVIDDAVDTVMDIKRQSKGAGLQFILDWFEELLLNARFATPSAEINVLRQGFILLMNAFDAAVFDLVRIKLTKDFCKLIGRFGKQDKVSLKEFGDAGSLGDFSDQLIERQLKGMYFKELLTVLSDLGVQCADHSTGNRFVHLVELVLRRNIHVHNRGIVDERYLERDDKGTPKYKLFDLKVGEPAAIDEAYWERANRLCADCVSRVAAWVEQ
jgi:hypothetical protein